jgi:tetratricopeptide (TPR) repeat protein
LPETGVILLVSEFVTHPRSRRPASLALALAIGLAVFAPTLAHADDIAKAKALFSEGISLEASNNFSGALDKFQQVATIKRSPAVTFHIALCQEKVGRLNESLGGYRVANHDASEAQTANGKKPDPKLDEIIQKSGDAITSLEKRIPSITLKKPGDVTSVKLDGVAIAGESLKKPIKVDPGTHAIEATAPGREAFKANIEISEGENKTVDIKLKEAVGGGDDKKPDDKKPDDKKPDDKKPDDKKPVEMKSSYIPWVVLGGGGASLILSGVFYAQRNSALTDLNKQCVTGTLVCKESAKTYSDKGKSMTTLGNVFLGVGIVGVAAGVALVVTHPFDSPAAPATTGASTKLISPRVLDLALTPTQGGAGAHVLGQFLHAPVHTSARVLRGSRARLRSVLLPRSRVR